jgi:hypothetical protein
MIFYDGLAKALKNRKWGVINTNGIWVIQPHYYDLMRI